jgi:gliding motility-associated-like protein
MKKFILWLLVLFGLNHNNIFAQQGNIWYFGNGAGVDFNSGSPVALSGSVMSTSEGCTSIDDNNGDLLFYTDGTRVYNSNHVVMSNGTGLSGEGISAQSAVIVPTPGDPNLYYIFTMRNWTTGGDGVHYSIVDMSLNGGLGDVTSKNIFVNTEARESLSATKHCNGIDYWVTFYDRSVNSFYTYLLTNAGLSATPVISNVGSMNITSNRFGYLKFSPNGQRLAYALGDASGTTGNTTVELYNFNTSTGVVSMPQVIATTPTIWGVYGCEFSPSSNILYISGFNESYIYQYDLLAGTTAQIVASQTDVSGGSPSTKSSLQIGPDGKIYVSLSSLNRLGVIDNPDNIGLTCNYIDVAVTLSSGTNCSLGLPNFISSTFYGLSTQVMEMCPGDSVLLPWGDYADSSGLYTDTFTSIYGCDSLVVVEVNISSLIQINQTASICPGDSYTLPNGGVVNSPGTYYDTLTSVGCDTVIVTQLNLTSVVLLTQNASICPGDSYTLPNGGVVTTPGTYYDTLASVGCDTVMVTQLSLTPAVQITQNASICPGGSYTLPNGGVVSIPGTYYDTTSSGNCDTIVVTQLALTNIIQVSQNVSICEGSSYTLPNGGVANSSGTYYDTVITSGTCDTIIATHLTVGNPQSSQSASICAGNTYMLPNGSLVSIAGIYSDTLTSASGCDSIVTTTLSVSILPTANFSVSTATGIPELDVVFNNSSQNASAYLWFFGDGTGSSLFNPEHTYTSPPDSYTVMLVAFNGLCRDTITMTVIVDEDFSLVIPNVFTPNGDDKNEKFKIETTGVTDILVEIYDRWGLKLYEWNSIVGSWDGRTNKGKIASDGTYYYIMHATDKDKKKHTQSGYFSLLR